MGYLVYFIVVISTIVQDLPLSNQFGFIASSLTALIIPLLFTFIIVYFKKIKISKYTKVLFKIYIYLMIINIIGLFIYIVILNNDVHFWDQSLVVKSIKSSIYLLEICLFMVIIENLQMRLKIKHVYFPFVVTYFVLFIILIIELTNPSLLSAFHSSSEQYNRIRLLTTESSNTGSLIVVFFSVTLYYFTKINFSITMLVLSWLSFFAFVLTSGSKGFISGILLAVFFLVLKNTTIKSLKGIFSLLIYGCILFVAYQIFVSLFLESYITDFNEYTSIATRSYTTFVALFISIIYPFGIGTSLYPIIYVEQLQNNLELFMGFNLNLNEIYSLIRSSDGENVTAKSSIAQYSMYIGVIGILYFMYAYWYKIYKMVKNKSDILLFTFIFLFISITFYASFEIKYEIWAFLSLIYLKNLKDRYLDE